MILNGRPATGRQHDYGELAISKVLLVAEVLIWRDYNIEVLFLRSLNQITIWGAIKTDLDGKRYRMVR